jgi:YidC/Oxa1 family membrane protein insertase
MNKKLFLYAILAFICFSLWNLWQKDYGQNPENTSPNTAINATTNQTATTKTAANTANSSNIAALTLEAMTRVDTNHLIKVQTDILDVTIDTVGGNIVEVALLKYADTLHSKKPVKLLSFDVNKFYVAKSSLISKVGPDLPNNPAVYTTEKESYTLEPNQNTLAVKLIWKNNSGLSVCKTFTFTRQKYDIAVDYNVINNLKEPWSGTFSTQIQRKNFGEKPGLFKFSTYEGAAISSTETPYEKVSYSNMDKNNIDRDIVGGWAAFQQRYFLSAWIPNQTKTYQYFSNVNEQIYTIGMRDNSLNIAPGGNLTVTANFYTGPEVADNLKTLAKGLDLTADYGWLWIISVGLFWVLKHINMVVGNWGWSIVLVTVLIKVAFFKPSEKSYRSMAKMKDLAPKIKALKERYGDDRQKLHQATMELYKKDNVNPLSGCLPMLIQIPFFIALYYVLMGAVELRHAPFMFWIQDLSVRDPYFILPILMGLSMFLQQRISPTSADPQQAKIMMMMPIIFTMFFLSFPAGLVLYWLVNNCLSIWQQWYIMKKQ